MRPKRLLYIAFTTYPMEKMMQKRKLMLVLSALIAGGAILPGCTTTKPESPNATVDSSKRQSIDSSVQATLTRLYETVPGSRELVGKARGVLVFPNVVQAGLIVGGQTGDGALRVGGQTVGYYNTTSLSVGWQAGAQSKAVILLFMTEDALRKFRESDGWSADANASIAVLKVGANGAIDTTTATSAVQAIILTNAGLMGDVSLGGTKITKLKL
jgi:lipid-binding SYLF domain-containing protein